MKGVASPALPDQPKVTLFMPVLNEIEGLRAIVPQIQPDWFDQVLMVDGGSRDGSIEYARERGIEVYVQKRKGIRFAYIEAWPLIRGEVVLTFSPDGNLAVSTALNGGLSALAFDFRYEAIELRPPAAGVRQTAFAEYQRSLPAVRLSRSSAERRMPWTGAGGSYPHRRQQSCATAHKIGITEPV